MKKYLWILLLIPSLCFGAAGDLETIGGKVDTAITSIAGKAGTAIATICGKNYTDGDAAAAYCTGAATCTATTPGQCDLLCEDFEGSTDCDGAGDGEDAVCRNGWATTIGSGDSIDFTTAHSGTFGCTDKGSNAVQVVITASSHATHASFNAGGTKAATYTQFYINVTSESLTSTQSTYLVSADVASNMSQVAWRFVLYDDYGTYYFKLTYYNTTPGFSTIQSTDAISLDTWYRVQVYHNSGDSTISWWIDGVAQTGDTNFGARNPQYWFIGDNASDNATTFQVDNIAVDDDTTQGACN
jgi:hypothetical protein